MSESLIVLAETLNAARIMANADPVTEAWSGVYGKAAQALEETLSFILGSLKDAEVAYDAILDGCTVREALAVAR